MQRILRLYLAQILQSLDAFLTLGNGSYIINIFTCANAGRKLVLLL